MAIVFYILSAVITRHIGPTTTRALPHGRTYNLYVSSLCG